MDDDTVEVAGESQGTALRRVDVLPQGCNDVVAVAGDQNANVLRHPCGFKSVNDLLSRRGLQERSAVTAPQCTGSRSVRPPES
ncbi:MAG: hypothetical protein ACK56F_12720, partial [bacterium]